MSISYSMTDDSFSAKLEGIKRRTHKLFNATADALDEVREMNITQIAKDAVDYKKRGGLHFAKVGNASVSWSFKKVPVPVALPAQTVQEPISDQLAARMARFVR